MSHSRKPSVWVEKRRGATGFVSYRVRREKDGRRLPDIPCGPDKAVAARVAAEERARLWQRRLRIDEQRTEIITLSQFAARDRASRQRRMAVKTVYNDQRALDLLRESAGDIALPDIDRRTIEDLETFLEKREYSRGAGPRRYHINGIRIILRALKAALRRALKAELLDRDPFFGFELPPGEEVANPPSDEEIQAFWANIPHMGQCALTIVDTCGLRSGEVLNITRHSITRPEGPDAPWILRVQKSKTRRGKVEFKTMALHPVAVAALELMRPWPAEGSIFKLSRNTLSSWVRKARRKAGLGRIRLHDFRHRWATELMQKSQDKYAVMQAGGWTSEAAAARYQHSTRQRRDVTLQQKPNLPPILPPNERAREARKTGS